jgi:hypothetical protein
MGDFCLDHELRLDRHGRVALRRVYPVVVAVLSLAAAAAMGAHVGSRVAG